MIGFEVAHTGASARKFVERDRRRAGISFVQGVVFTRLLLVVFLCYRKPRWNLCV